MDYKMILDREFGHQESMIAHLDDRKLFFQMAYNSMKAKLDGIVPVEEIEKYLRERAAEIPNTDEADIAQESVAVNLNNEEVLSKQFEQIATANFVGDTDLHYIVVLNTMKAKLAGMIPEDEITAYVKKRFAELRKAIDFESRYTSVLDNEVKEGLMDRQFEQTYTANFMNDPALHKAVVLNTMKSKLKGTVTDEEIEKFVNERFDALNALFKSETEYEEITEM
ncbi:MAG: hypothetical protein IKX81_00995 [Firmicutes bacterium]|nr:hypothetical protein [Bacillota bacterium]